MYIVVWQYCVPKGDFEKHIYYSQTTRLDSLLYKVLARVVFQSICLLKQTAFSATTTNRTLEYCF